MSIRWLASKFYRKLVTEDLIYNSSTVCRTYMCKFAQNLTNIFMFSKLIRPNYNLSIVHVYLIKEKTPMDAETPQNGNVPSAKPAKQQKRRHSYKQIFNGFHHQQKTKKKQRKVTQSNAAKV